VADAFQELQQGKVDGQEDMEAARTEALEDHAKKDESGQAVKKVNPQTGQSEYDIEDWGAFQVDMEHFRDVTWKEVLDSMQARAEEVTDFLTEECDDFDPYMFDAEYLPVDKDGNSRLTPLQLRYLLPFVNDPESI
jgi:hypothetical protein